MNEQVMNMFDKNNYPLGVGGWILGEFGIDMYTLLYLKWITGFPWWSSKRLRVKFVSSSSHSKN